MDPVPSYYLQKYILKLPANHDLVVKTKEKILSTKWVKDILMLQQEDGSFGHFHSLSYSNNYSITTEQALRRLRVLGLDYRDLCIKKIVMYMEGFLLGKEKFPDRREKIHDWDIYTHLMAATQIRRFFPESELAMGIANQWKEIIEYAFSDNGYNQRRYEEVYEAIFSIKPRGGRLVDFVHFYPLILLGGLLSKKIECLVLDYVINHPTGIYYVYDKPLNILPESFTSKQGSRYLSGIEILSEYTNSKDKLSFAADWLMNNVSEDGFWDMGTAVKDNVVFPLSSSWRNNFNRKLDCTVRIMALLTKLGYTF
ncbi:MAG: hypothetical protein K0R09_571 [Clostridiales bacterium]|jgi:hypothetical protein|nr:hypothetical protein [Clostridiales bacterium]